MFGHLIFSYIVYNMCYALSKHDVFPYPFKRGVGVVTGCVVPFERGVIPFPSWGDSRIDPRIQQFFVW